MNAIIKVLMTRDSMSKAEANDALDAAREEVMEGYDPEEILQESFGLEPDYIYDLLEGL